MNYKTIIQLIICTLLSTNVLAKDLGAHVHGAVSLDIATDKKQLLIMLNSPSDSFLGFEYQAKSKTEKELLEKVKSDWTKKIINYLGSQSLEGCNITKSNWKQKFNGKNHSSIEAEAYIKCESSLKGRILEISLKKNYNHIKEINVQLLRDDGSAVKQKQTKEIFHIKL